MNVAADSPHSPPTNLKATSRSDAPPPSPWPPLPPSEEEVLRQISSPLLGTSGSINVTRRSLSRLNGRGPQRLHNKLVARGVSPFDFDVLLFPIHSPGHWTFAAIHSRLERSWPRFSAGSSSSAGNATSPQTTPPPGRLHRPPDALVRGQEDALTDPNSPFDGSSRCCAHWRSLILTRILATSQRPQHPDPAPEVRPSPLRLRLHPAAASPGPPPPHAPPRPRLASPTSDRPTGGDRPFLPTRDDRGDAPLQSYFRSAVGLSPFSPAPTRNCPLPSGLPAAPPQRTLRHPGPSPRPPDRPLHRPPAPSPPLPPSPSPPHPQPPPLPAAQPRYPAASRAASVSWPPSVTRPASPPPATIFLHVETAEPDVQVRLSQPLIHRTAPPGPPASVNLSDPPHRRHPSNRKTGPAPPAPRPRRRPPTTAGTALGPRTTAPIRVFRPRAPAPPRGTPAPRPMSPLPTPPGPSPPPPPSPVPPSLPPKVPPLLHRGDLIQSLLIFGLSPLGYRP
eukprot:tig00000381_g24535.t1